MSSVNQISASSVNLVLRSSVNELTTLLKPTLNYQPNDCNCGENSQVSLLWPIGVGFLLFTNLITIIVLIISCLWFTRSKIRQETL